MSATVFPSLRRLFIFLIAGELCLVVVFTHRTEAFSIIAQENVSPAVEIVLPWDAGSLAEVERKAKELAVQVHSAEGKWSVPLARGEFSLSERNYVQFASWQLPLPEGEKVEKFGMVRKRLLHFPEASVREKITRDIIPALHKDRQDVIIRSGSGGTITFEGKAINGRKVDVSSLLSSVYMAAEQGQNAVAAPVVLDHAQVKKVGLEDVNIRELIATGLSDFSGSPKNRITNIYVGVARFNGVVIKQGATFSFNTQLGPVDGKHGFEPELVIIGPRTQREFGGGLCQVSSTLFRAALYAGLPVTARRNHSYFVTYYEWPHGPGFDATIYPGSQDLKFVNDTPGDILVQAYVEDTKVYYKFYGISDGRSVKLSNPSVYNRRGIPDDQVVYVSNLAPSQSRVREKPHPGFTASFTREIIFPSRETKRDTFVSVYQARPKVIERGGTDPNASSPPIETYYTGDIGT